VSGLTFWTDERIERLKQLWAQGLSCSQIASELGGVSRNGVIGKVHRLGLAARHRTPAKPKLPRHRVVKARPWRVVPAAALVAVVTQPLEAAMPPPTVRYSLLDLKPGQCKWPHGDPQNRENFWFCGGKAIDGHPYCLQHCRLAYRLPEGRRKAA
jgi:GcrA cell cycle regulator